LYPFYINSVPALYAGGFQSYADDGVEFGNLVYIGPSPAFVVLSFCPWIIYRARKRMLSKSISTLLEKLLDPVFGLFGSSENMTAVDDTSLALTRPIIHCIWRLLKIIYVTILTVVLGILGLMFLWSINFWGSPMLSTVVYVYKAYLRHEADPSKSCFLMPCSPQSIKDEDQVWSLFAGLFSFVASEVIMPMYKEFQRRSGEEKEFVESVEGAFRQDRDRRSAPEHATGIHDAVEPADLRRRATGP
jgi:hypothetical protein